MTTERTLQARLFLQEYAELCRKHGFIVDVVTDVASIIDISQPDVIGWNTEQQLEQHIRQLRAESLLDNDEG
jgi:hypothetical protein